MYVYILEVIFISPFLSLNVCEKLMLSLLKWDLISTRSFGENGDFPLHLKSQYCIYDLSWADLKVNCSTSSMVLLFMFSLFNWFLFSVLSFPFTLLWHSASRFFQSNTPSYACSILLISWGSLKYTNICCIFLFFSCEWLLAKECMVLHCNVPQLQWAWGKMSLWNHSCFLIHNTGLYKTILWV